jgi:uncharacterized protein (DUF305 family)
MSTFQQRRDSARATPPPASGDQFATPASSRPAGSARTLRLVLLAVIAVMVLGIAGAGGYLLRGGSDTAAGPSDSSVDAGFARDMLTHHEQAVQMAITVEYASTDPEVRTLAFDIETSQTYQEGQMNGWLDSWGLTRQTGQAIMGWMSGMDHGHSATNAATDPTGANTALMPGMATPAEIAKLDASTGTAQDVLFLQYMLRHHQGGIDMAQDAVDHATQPYVQALAQKMVTIQTREVVLMEQMLRARGAQPLTS